MPVHPLERLNTILTAQEFPVMFLEKGGEQPYNEILVNFEEKRPEPKYTLQMTLLDEVMEEPESTILEADYLPLQLYLFLPLEVPEARALSVYRLISSFNNFLPYGYFELNETGDNKGLEFKYTMLVDAVINVAQPIIDILLISQFYVTRLGDELEAFVNSDLDVQTAVDKARDFLESEL